MENSSILLPLYLLWKVAVSESVVLSNGLSIRMSIFYAGGPPPANLWPTLDDYVRYGGGGRLHGKFNWNQPNPINPSNTGTTPNFDEIAIGQDWFKFAYLQRKQKALNRTPAFEYFEGVNIPFERGSRYENIATGNIGHTHTGPYGAKGGLIYHKKDNVLRAKQVAPHGAAIYTPRLM